VATGLIEVTRTAVVTNACIRPLVVHSPNNTFSTPKDFLQVIQREETLAYPMQMDDIGFLEFW
jgi:hypothetical protein